MELGSSNGGSSGGGSRILGNLWGQKVRRELSMSIAEERSSRGSNGRFGREGGVADGGMERHRTHVERLASDIKRTALLLNLEEVKMV